MANEYVAPEVVEIAEAQSVICGPKFGETLDVDSMRDFSDSELDD